jgi:hypothetical protein
MESKNLKCRCGKTLARYYPETQMYKPIYSNKFHKNGDVFFFLPVNIICKCNTETKLTPEQHKNKNEVKCQGCGKVIATFVTNDEYGNGVLINLSLITTLECKNGFRLCECAASYELEELRKNGAKANRSEFIFS